MGQNLSCGFSDRALAEAAGMPLDALAWEPKIARLLKVARKMA